MCETLSGDLNLSLYPLYITSTYTCKVTIASKVQDGKLKSFLNDLHIYDFYYVILETTFFIIFLTTYQIIHQSHI